MGNNKLLPLFILLALITQPVLPLYAIYLIRYTHASPIILNAIAVVHTIISLLNYILHTTLTAHSIMTIAFIYTLLLPSKKNKNIIKKFIDCCKIPYLVLDDKLTIVSHNSAGTSLPFYSSSNFKNKLSLATLENGESLYIALSHIFQQHGKICRSGTLICNFSTIYNGSMQCNRYDIHYQLCKPNKMYLSFINVTSDYILKQKSEYEKLKLKITSTISHELRNPLNGIIGIFSHLKKNIDKNFKNLTLTGISSLHMMRYKVDSFIDLVQIMSKELTLNNSEIIIDNFLYKLKKIFAPLIKNGVVFSIKKDTLLPKSFMQDEDRLMQIIVRLVNNALKYTAKGMITFEICVRTKSDLQFIVTDTGTGITPSKIKSIRKSAISLIPDISINENNENIALSGLGLGTIQLVLEKMGSKLDIQSEPEMGSRFSFILSLKETSLNSNKFHRRSAFSSLSDFKKLHIKIKSKRPIPDEFNESEGIFSPSTKFPNIPSKDKVKISLKRQSSNFEIVNVLVVDDCSVNRMVHKMLLEKYSNFKITEHCNGAEAVDYIKILSQNNPNKVLILMDINMPVMDGIEATKAIRMLNVDFPISIIAVSAFSNEEDIQKITDCGMDSYITKPVTKESLSRILSLAC